VASKTEAQQRLVGHASVAKAPAECARRYSSGRLPVQRLNAR
jgi:hypothetical protein